MAETSTTNATVYELSKALPNKLLNKDGSITDFQGNKEIIDAKYGCSLVPNTYTLGKSEEYSYLISDDSAKRAIFEEEV